MVGNRLSPRAAIPLLSANSCNSPPRKRNNSTTSIKITAKVIMFFWESFSVLTLMFFCIISWSIPVMVMEMKAPATICFTKKYLLAGSVTKMLE
jgi:hypothetical protein